MLTFKTGDLFKYKFLEALVNPVNCIGVSGKGLALEFKKRYPDNFVTYTNTCRRNALRPGKLVVCKRKKLPYWIINFPTKLHWREPSSIEYIEKGLDALVVFLSKTSVRSMGIPALGCGLGGLSWVDVKPLITVKLETVEPTHFIVYEPE